MDGRAVQAFRQFKSNASGRAAAADGIARAFPAAFNYDRLRVNSSEVATISQERLVELLGRPSVSLSLVDRPEYLGASVLVEAERASLACDQRSNGRGASAVVTAEVIPRAIKSG
jgi:hypothetical protein